uniref:Uncharacterized protein n=1 Tax=Ditylenchus dipsaci TaxID=166011 RepID=A0A915CLQ4_9BILA
MDASSANTAKTTATNAIEEGKILTQKAFDAEHLAEDASMDVAALLQAITKAKAKTTPVNSKLNEAESTAKAAQESITTEMSAVKGHVETFQTATQVARTAFYAADFLVNSGLAVAQLTKDVDQLKKDSNMKAKTSDAKAKSNAAMLATNALTASATREKLAEAKESCVKALKTARELEILVSSIKYVFIRWLKKYGFFMAAYFILRHPKSVI